MRMFIVAGAVALSVSAAGLISLEVMAAQKPAAKPAAASSASTGIDRLLAPIALYPDQLLAQMLLCAGEPAKVAELDAWLAANKTLQGTALQDEATVAGFAPHFVALALFPQVVSSMAQQPDVTAQLGKAFATNRTAVFDSIQRLRKQAHESGALKTTPQQEVETKTTPAGEQVIVIEPSNPQIVYVPQYNPTVVYTQPPPTTIVVEDNDDTDAAVAGLIGFTAGIAIGAAIDNDYYYGPYGWHGGAYMYNDAWDDYADAREDAREDWQDHREDLVEERGERSRETQEQRTERTESRQENRPESRTNSTASGSSYEARGHRDSETAARDRSGTKSDAFSGYSSGKSERAASSRGQRSRSTSRGGGGGGRRR